MPAAPGSRVAGASASLCGDLPQLSPPQQSSASCNLRKPGCAGCSGGSVGLRKQWATPPAPTRPPQLPPPSHFQVWDRQKQLRTRVGVACLSFSVPSCVLRGEKLPFTLLAGQRGLEHMREPPPPGLLLPRSAFHSPRRYTGFCKPAFVSCISPPPLPLLKIFLLINKRSPRDHEVPRFGLL